MPLEEDFDYKPYRSINRSILPKLGMQINCPNCAEQIESDNINIDKGVAKCGNCNTVFSYEDDTHLSYRRRPEVFMPEEFEVLPLRNELSIHYKWRKTRSISASMIFFTVLWNAMLLPFIIAVIASGNLFTLIGIGVHLLVGLGLITNIILTLINSTYITVDDYELAIEHRPFALPLFAKNQYIDVKEIEQIYVQKYVSETVNGVAKYAYQIIAQLKNGEEVKVLKGFRHKDKALYVEQEIEIFLDIPDKAVKGEVS